MDRAIAERAERLAAGLDLAEATRLLSGADFWHTEALPADDGDAAVPAVRLSDGPHGLRVQDDTGDHMGLGGSRPATCFPTASALACSWDEALLAEVGAAIGAEARAQGVGAVLGPGLNLVRHPAGGRTFEYLSEDPVLAGRLAAAMIRGIQSKGVGACAKHFAANHQERTRMTIDTLVDARTLHELELQAFEIAVTEGRPWAVMAAYNRLNGPYASESPWLLTDLLRERWGFDGLVVSDWGGVDDRVAGVRAGMDLQMPGGPGAADGAVRAAVVDGRLPRAAVDRCAARVLALGLRHQAASETAPPPADDDAHHAVARRAAADSAVLLANDGLLPLAPDGTVAVLGALAEQPRVQGAGSSRVVPTRLDAPLPALLARLGDTAVDYAPAYDRATGATNDDLLAEATRAAQAADAAVLLVGLPEAWAAEGLDRPHLRLPEGQLRAIEAVCAANPRTVVVDTSGAPVEMPFAHRPAALLDLHLAGQAAGSALADLLLGAAEPGGRLALSVPVAASDLPADRWFSRDADRVEHREGLAVGYRFHDTAGVPARFAFGHGLGYADIAIEHVELVGDHAVVAGAADGRASLPEARAEVAVTLHNRGERDGAQVVQCYVRDVQASVPRPEQELAAFAKVRLAPGERRTVRLEVAERAFAWFDPERDDWVVEAGAHDLLVGRSSTAIDARLRVEVPGAPPVVTDDDDPRRLQPVGSAVDAATFERLLGRPLPPRRPARPFHRNSTVGDLRATRTGRLLRAGILRAARSQGGGGMAGEDAGEAFLSAIIDQLPLRALVSMSGGRLGPRALQRLLWLLNGPLRGRRGRRGGGGRARDSRLDR